ncbi:MAG: prepilin peptidase [Patescibacteria group bacterium]|jgi:prepilin signal peptidase PulO-like enzyme (type II secretory pathway)
MIEFFVIILGLVIGSFLNAVIYRLHVGVSFMKGHSYCPFCKHNLDFRDLFPVFSFIFLKGKCRYCRKKISWQYPLVELATAMAFLLLYFKFGLSATFAVYLIYTVFLIIIFVFDWRYYLVLDKVSIPAVVIAFLLSFFVLKISLLSLLLGLLIGGGFFLLQYLVSRGKWIGGGDIRLGLMMGAMLGYQALLVALFIAYFTGSLGGLGLIFSGRKKWKSQVPFGTFLSLATFAAFLIGSAVILFYKNLLIL